MFPRKAPILALSTLFAACGGGPRVLSMAPVAPAFVDESSLSPRLQGGRFERIMIVPPSGSAGVEFQESQASIERSFIARGITVISSAITSRVILGDETRDRQRAQEGLSLSEVERALLLAKQSNADAVLQIGTWNWAESNASPLGRRFFVEDKKAKRFDEVDEGRYEQAGATDALRYWFGSRVLAFTGRLIDVESGEILASFKIDVPVVNLADPITVSFDGDGNVLSSTYDWAEDVRRNNAASQKAISTLFDRLAALLSQS